eukprot:TRINITY_DN2265_c0_g1_i2.p1 TRINITY_DN2265_c0_g1~~TRINITY_DN2265_c0_g1_i2.p1  ORF type:complete len:454 (-),score=152.84 TRINITY_DN2265_c0_g1_i2:1433-2761(-)
MDDDEALLMFGSLLNRKSQKQENPNPSQIPLRRVKINDDEEEANNDTSETIEKPPLTKEDIIKNDIPTLLKFLGNMQDQTSDLRSKLAILIQRLEENAVPTSEGLSYMHAKIQIMINYIMDLLYMLNRKVKGESVDGHPVVSQTIRSRLILEKIKGLDTKLKYQIDKLLKMAAMADDPALREELMKDQLSHKPNLKSFTDDNDYEDGKGGAEDGDDLGSSVPDKYVPPKRNAIMFEDRATKAQKDEDRAREKAKRSRMAKLLAEQYGDAPTLLTTRGDIDDPDENNFTKKNDRITEFEEDNFVRVDRMKKKKKKQGDDTPLSNALADLESYSDIAILGKDYNEDGGDDDMDFTSRRNPKKRSREDSFGGGDDGIEDDGFGSRKRARFDNEGDSDRPSSSSSSRGGGGRGRGRGGKRGGGRGGRGRGGGRGGGRGRGGKRKSM